MVYFGSGICTLIVFAVILEANSALNLRNTSACNINSEVLLSMKATLRFEKWFIQKHETLEIVSFSFCCLGDIRPKNLFGNSDLAREGGNLYTTSL